MQYQSTRNNNIKVSSAEAITQGISSEGGLFLPDSCPLITSDEINSLVCKTYEERAVYILSKFLTDFTDEEIKTCVYGAYGSNKFDDIKKSPVKKISDNMYMLELWHGPTCAFKDMALQLLPFLLTTSAKKTGDKREIVILVATSGDTGKAALEGFKDVEGTSILVFYPQDGVSSMQKLQMTTQEGGNVSVCAIKGNFDDAQTGVKTIFTNAKIAEKLNENNMVFSSANSINWGRLVPQIVYYISAYCDMIENGEIKLGEKINFVVPTGNFGNILAGFYAQSMGLPINKLICASNSNNVITDFIKTGTYDKNRSFFTTTSPSMDILISSNLERLIYLLSNYDDNLTASYMNDLSKLGKYTVNNDIFLKLKGIFYGAFCDDEDTKDIISKLFIKNKYLCDTHTAVGVSAYEEYTKNTGDNTKTVIASTASPFKFADSVLEAIGGDINWLNDFELLNTLSKKAGVKAPNALLELSDKDVRFSDICTLDTMEQVVLDLLKIK